MIPLSTTTTTSNCITKRTFRDITNAENICNNANKNDGSNVAAKTKKQALASIVPPRQHNLDTVVPTVRPSLVQRPISILSNVSNNKSTTTTSYQYTGVCDDIDKRDAHDPSCVTEYVQGMYEHFRSMEKPSPVYMETQPHLNEHMRSILVDWIVEIHYKFNLVPETLYLTVNVIDRYLAREQVDRATLQLVGVTALLIACKYEEIYPPPVQDCVQLCDNAYTFQEIIDMETKILKTLNYQVTIPSAHAFLVRFLKAAHANKTIVQLSCYILDGTLENYNLTTRYLPSQLAAAAVFIARRTVGRNSWSPTLLRYANYCEEEIAPVARAVLAEKSTTLGAVNKKYSSSRFGSVASMALRNDV